MELIEKIRDKLITFQISGETDLFKFLYSKRPSLPNNDLSQLGFEEYKYFWYYADCFILELSVIPFLIPLGYYFYLFTREKAKANRDILKMKSIWVKMLFFGVPAMNLYCVNIYRRYFVKHNFEGLLGKKYYNEIKAFKKQINNKGNKLQ